MPGPTVTFAFILATLFGAIFHLFMGGDVRRLALFLLAGWIGFSLGHVLGVVFEINIMNIGPLRIVAASIGAIVALIVARFLTANRANRYSSR